MTREEFHALVDTQFDELETLQQQPTLLEYKQKFTHIWTGLGNQVLQATMGKVPENPRKKQVSNPVW